MNQAYPQGGVVPNQNTMYPMAQLQGSTYSPVLNYNQPTEVVSGYDAKVDPMTGQEIPDANFARGGEVGLASLLASRGRNGDKMLVHMTPEEVKGLQSLALTYGGSLTINPDTGLPEANILKKLLPTVAGFTLNSLFPGLGTVGSSLLVAGVTGLAEGSFSKGLKAGLGAYSGASIREALSRVAAEKAAAQELAKLGQATTQAAAGEGAKEALGLTQSAVELPAQTVKGLQIPAMKLGQPSPISMPGLSGESIRALSSAVGESAAAARPTFRQLGQGLRSLTERGGLENFVTALGGPTKAGFIASPITQAIEEAELEEQEKAMRRAQAGGAEFPYYIPGKFDFATGSFAPGAYYTRSGQPYKPSKPFGFADGGIVDLAPPLMIDPRNMPGRDPIVTYPPDAPQPITPPAVAATQAFSFPQPRDVRRDITDQYIYDLNARLARGLPAYQEPTPPAYVPPEPPVTPPIDIPIVPPGFLPPGFTPVIPRDEEPLPQPPPSSIEPTIPDYYPIEPREPYIRFPTIVPIGDKEKKPTIEIEALPENIAPDYEGLPITRVPDFSNPIEPREPYIRFPTIVPIGGKEGKPTTEIEALPENIAPDYEGAPITRVPDFSNPFVPAPIESKPKEYGIQIIEGLPENFMRPADPDIPVQLDLSNLAKEIGIDPNIEKNLKAQLEAEEKSWLQKGLDFVEASGGGIGAFVGAGRELFGPGETNVRDFLEAAARGYIPDYIEKPVEKVFSNEVIAEPEVLTKEAIESGVKTEEQAAKEEAAKEEEENVTTPAEPGQEVIDSYVGGGGGGFESGLGGPTNYYDNSLQNFLDQFYMDQLMGGGNRTYSVGVETLAGGGEIKRYAQGGLGSTQEYRAGGKFLRGPGDGMSDDIRANIDGKQEARLADGEFVIPADVVSHLGNGSSNAGAKKLYQMMARVRQARTGKKKQAPAVKMDRHLPA